LPAPTHTYASNGNFTVTLTATNGGCTDVSTGTVNIIGVGLKEVTSAVESIRLFPNPNNGVATLQIFSSNAEVVELSLTDLSGKVLLNNTLDLTSGTNQFNINTSDFGAGIYLLQIRNAAFHQSLRMVVNQ
jgi:PKD repeat protein